MSQLQSDRPHDPWPNGPWLLRAIGGEWAASTNGRVLVLVDRERIEGDLPDAPLKVSNMTEKWLSTPPLASQSVGADALRVFAGVGVPLPNCALCDNARTLDCDTCDGTGEVTCECFDCGHEHDASCDDCEGGKRPCRCAPVKEKYYARFAGGFINRPVLRLALEAVPLAGEVTIDSVNLNDKPQARVECFRLRGDGWCAVVMGLRDSVGSSADFDKPETWHIAPTAA